MNIDTLQNSAPSFVGAENAVNGVPASSRPAGRSQQPDKIIAECSSAPAGADKSPAGAATAARPRSLNPTQFINRAAVRDFLLAEAKKTRAHKFHRVSEDTLVAINEIVRAACVGHVRRVPSKGKTL